MKGRQIFFSPDRVVYGGKYPWLMHGSGGTVFNNDLLIGENRICRICVMATSMVLHQNNKSVHADIVKEMMF